MSCAKNSYDKVRSIRFPLPFSFSSSHYVSHLFIYLHFFLLLTEEWYNNSTI